MINYSSMQGELEKTAEGGKVLRLLVWLKGLCPCWMQPSTAKTVRVMAKSLEVLTHLQATSPERPGNTLSPYFLLPCSHDIPRLWLLSIRKIWIILVIYKNNFS